MTYKDKHPVGLRHPVVSRLLTSIACANAAAASRVLAASIPRRSAVTFVRSLAANSSAAVTAEVKRPSAAVTADIWSSRSDL